MAQPLKQDQLLTPVEIDAYKQQAGQLVKAMQYTFNLLGSSDATAREKDIIIQQSFLKFFKSSKVQIEDDLIEGRFVVTNKDVQAYLKDIDFFFTHAAFDFQTEEITYNVNNQGQIFFVVSCFRTIEGISIENEKIKNTIPRFIEINLDPDKRDLKIVSIYTTHLSEKEDMRQWWSRLDAEWRLILAKGTPFGKQFMMRDVISFDEKWAVIEQHKIVMLDNYALESRRGDTIYTNTTELFNAVRRIWATEELDISKYAFIASISPLSKLTQLKNLNISKTAVDDLTPIRNLTRLETLDFSETRVLTIEGLRFAIGLKNLNFDKTGVYDIETLAGLQWIERLYANNTQITNISPLENLENLRDLRIANTRVNNLNPISKLQRLNILDLSSTQIESLDDLANLQNLERLLINNTAIKDLSALKSLPKLEWLSIEANAINDISVLLSLPELKRIYCDRTLIGYEKASQFSRQKPQTLVVYESQALGEWWQNLPSIWKEIFRNKIKISEVPTREELHELATLAIIDLSGNQDISNLDALQKLTRLKKVNISNTQISSLASLKENIDLQWLDISGTPIEDLTPLSSLDNLEYLNISSTRIKSIHPLAQNKLMRQLNLEKTSIVSISALAKLNNLELVYADQLNVPQWEAKAIYDTNPSVLMIYRTSTLNEWWNSISTEWKKLLRQQIEISEVPTREQLQRLTDIRALEISQESGLRNLMPLVVFHRLQVLAMNATQISDLTPLQNLVYLKELYCANNPIKKLTPLRNLPSLTKLDCSNTKITSIGDISKLATIEYLNISGTSVWWLEPVKSLKALKHLECYNSRVIILSPLKHLPKLETLKCYNTYVSAKGVAKLKRSLPNLEVVYY